MRSIGERLRFYLPAIYPKFLTHMCVHTRKQAHTLTHTCIQIRLTHSHTHLIQIRHTHSHTQVRHTHTHTCIQINHVYMES